MEWEYAELVKVASECGGPKAMLKIVFDAGMNP